MKNIILSILTLFLMNSAFAQVSDATVLAKIKSSNRDIISLKLTGNGWTERVLEKGVWVKYYRKSYEIKQKTSYPGITVITVNHLTYKNSGSGYRFDGFGVPEYRLFGIPDPDKQEVIALLEADYFNFLESHHYNKIVGEVSEISFPGDVVFWWKDVDRVHFDVEVTYSKKVSNTELEKATHLYEVAIFYKDDYKGEMKGFRSFEDDSKRKVISTEKFSESELEAMKTLQMVDDENKAKDELSALPKIENLPVFESEKQMIYFLHEKIMTEDASTAKAYVYKMLSKTRKEGEYILKEFAKNWVDKIVENTDTYKKTFCMYPVIKEEQFGQVSFFDKEKYKNVTYVGTEEDGTWKIRDIHYYPSSKEDADRMANMQGSCGEKPDLVVRKEVTYEIGDVVDVKFSNGNFPAIVDKKDPNFSNRYFVKLVDGGRGYWKTEEELSPSTASNTTQAQETQQMGSVSEEEVVNEVAFKVNDKVGVKTRSGVMKGKIIKASNGKFLVKFRDPRYQDLWVAESNLELL